MEADTEPVTAELLAHRTATVDELLSQEFESLPGLKRDADRAAKRLAAWCNSSASGDWELFDRRLARDGHKIAGVLARFATARRRRCAQLPEWTQDAEWIQLALHGIPRTRATGHRPFEEVFSALADAAAGRLWSALSASVADRFAASARDDLRGLLIDALCALCAPVLYDRFAKCQPPRYDDFVMEMRTGGLIRIFGEKPVLLRLITVLTRQWLTTSTEFITRLDADFERVRNVLHIGAGGLVAHVKGGLSDAHDGGRSVLRVEFGDGSGVLYKPKDLRLDVGWHSLVHRLNDEAPVQLRAAAAVAGDGYGWTEFVEHTACDDAAGCQRFFRRAGAWLALFHCFAATDIHHENLVAAADHPVPIDLETLLQTPESRVTGAPAHEAARALIANSVAAVGLLPAYGKSATGVYAAGGVAAEWPAGQRLIWTDLNTDTMRPSVVQETRRPATNLPRVADRCVGLAEYVEDFVTGFREYATFLNARGEDLFDGFAGLPVRKVIRPTQFYAMLLRRLKDDRAMDDGVAWSAQADFLARLADWDSEADEEWPLQRAERDALLELNVPRVTVPGVVGLQRARARVRELDEKEIDWQVAVIRQTSPDLPDHGARSRHSAAPAPAHPGVVLTKAAFVAEADAIAAQLADSSIRRGTGAAWIGLGWFADSDVSQLTVLGHDLYNGACGIAMFLAAHAKITQSDESADLASAAIAPLRGEVSCRRAVRLGRVLGIGGATGLGSLIYSLAALSRLLGDEKLLAEAQDLAGLLSDDLIEADIHLDVIGGSAGAILSLLRLYRDTRSDEVLDRALACGRHLLVQNRIGPQGQRSWPCRTANHQVLAGMSHGAAGFAYALSALGMLTGHDEFNDAATECLGFEQASFDAEHRIWHDFRVGEPHWRSQWCHGAVGIGLARLGMRKLGGTWPDDIDIDIDRALAAAERGWPGHADTLCCGALGSVELVREAGKVLGRGDLQQLASRRLSAVLQTKAIADRYRWSAEVSSRFNVGLFRGLAGVGYTCLREVDDSLPNVLIWE